MFICISNQENGLKNVYSATLNRILCGIETYKKDEFYHEIVGFINGIPTCCAFEHYSESGKTKLEFVRKGLPYDGNETYICKDNANSFFCVCDTGRILFKAAGKKCCIKKYGKKKEEAYFIEDGENILVFNSEGRSI